MVVYQDTHEARRRLFRMFFCHSRSSQFITYQVPFISPSKSSIVEVVKNFSYFHPQSVASSVFCVLPSLKMGVAGMSLTVKTDNTGSASALERGAVMRSSDPLPQSTPVVQGYDFNKGVDYKALLKSYKNSGFQATSLGLAIDEVNRMLDCREQPLDPLHSDITEEDPFIRRRSNCTIFLGYTSNMVSCGIRDSIRFLVEHKMVDCIVTTAGGVEEDLIKCLGDTYVGDFHLDGRILRDKAVNRIGNLLVPNNNYCKFEDWVTPRLDALLEEQRKEQKIWSPSTIIERLGKEIDDPTSILYWAAKNQIPIFCPALTDGSLGDMMYFHSYKNPGLIVDILQDVKRVNKMAVRAANSGMIIVGGGIVKHHICNANLMRNGADFSVFINTSSEFDGSDAGARPDEAISWGKIKKSARPVKVYAEASLVFPLLVGETFATRHFAKKSA
uniref:deoxyhypusine synthase n=3 Tax=Lygus hesperus TaxID=30085 RepID=A0A146L376_LYGHE